MKLVKSDLTNNTLNAMIQALESDIEETNSLVNTINSFISEINTGNNLSGESYTKVKNKLLSYIDVLEIRKNTAQLLKETINSSINQMISYIGDETELDEAILPELIERSQKAEQSISWITQQINIETIDANKTELRRTLYATHEMLNEINKEKNKIEGLSSADNSAYSNLESAISKISKYNSAIISLQESQITIL